VNALVIHTDSLTLVLLALVAEVGLLGAWLLVWTIRHRSVPADPPVNALREAEKDRLSGSAQATSRTESESETS
jgi:hypothetical protein